MRPTFAPALLALCATFAIAQTNSQSDSTNNCHIGSYRLSDGSAIDIAPSDSATLRWRMFTGETGQLHPNSDSTWTSTFGWTGKPDGQIVSFSDCARGDIHFARQLGHRIAFDVSETVFDSHGTRLAGRLVLPRGNARVPIVILTHGSEHDSARDFNALQRMFPAHGIGAFVYDKRGTGASGGRYTQDFQTLADDAVAAMNETRRLAGARTGRVGYQGPSEGGWVAPIAANEAKVDFVVVSFGLAVTVLEEDQQSVALDMKFHGHSADDTRKALELARAGERVIETSGKQGYEEFDALRQQIQIGAMVQGRAWRFSFRDPAARQVRSRHARKKFDFHTPFRYEPMPTLRASTTPQLWVLGSDDLEAPSAETAARIKSLIAAGKNYTLAVYPGAEHGMTEYMINAKGERVSTRFVPGYFQMMADFIRDGRIGEHYGAAAITRPKNQ